MLKAVDGLFCLSWFERGYGLRASLNRPLGPTQAVSFRIFVLNMKRENDARLTSYCHKNNATSNQYFLSMR